MLLLKRNSIEEGNWVAEKLEEEDYSKIGNFNCSDDDLNEFFQIDALEHKKELLAVTYSLKMATEELPVAFISFCNDAIQLSRQERGKLLPPKKARYQFLPAVKIARLGVQKEFQRHNIGTKFINMAKRLFLKDNRTGCRFMTVDAYNTDRVINFYKKNDFKFLHEKDSNKKTRIMYFDLKRLEISYP